MNTLSKKMLAISAISLAILSNGVLAAPSGTVAFLMPDQASTRYEQHDFPGFKAEMGKLCPDCKVLYQNANADVSTQQQQFNSVKARK
jgi:D-xylose transport system substrate-binding protein